MLAATSTLPPASSRYCIASARPNPKSINDLISSSLNCEGSGCGRDGSPAEPGIEPNVLPGPAKFPCGSWAWGRGSRMAPVEESRCAPDGVGTILCGGISSLGFGISDSGRNGIYVKNVENTLTLTP